MRLEYQDSIDRFLLDRMTDDERNSFEKKCAGNPELEEQLEHTKNVKRVISERNELLAKFQEWDDEYNANKNAAIHNKRKWIYGISGVAAAIIVGYFLFAPSNISTPEASSELISKKTNKEIPIVDSIAINSEKALAQKDLLAKNEVGKKDKKNSTPHIDDEQVFSFSNNNIGKANTSQADLDEKELESVIERIKVITRRLSDLEREQASGDIEQIVYESSVSLLKHQRDRLCWRQSIILLNMSRKSEALTILDELRRTKGQYQHKADSLYNALNH